MDAIEINIILLGESGVGKSSLLLRYKSEVFKYHLPATFVDYYKNTINVKDKEVNLTIWDTAGQEAYRSIVRSYFRMADGVLLVYDVTNVTTFIKLSGWLSDLKSINETAEIIIAGNKNEDPSKKSVAVSIVKNFARDENLEYMEVSAKSGENVDKIFNYLTEKILAAKGIELSSEKHHLSDHETEPSERLKTSTSEDSPECILSSVQEQRLHSHEGVLTPTVVSSSTSETSGDRQFQEPLAFEKNSDSVLQPSDSPSRSLTQLLMTSDELGDLGLQSSDSLRRMSISSAVCALEYFDCLNENSSDESENRHSEIQTHLDKGDIKTSSSENLDRGTIVRLHDETQICGEPKKKKQYCVIL